MKKRFIGNSANNPFDSTEILSGIIENAEDITQHAFLRNCHVNSELRKDMINFPGDYSFSKYRSIYLFTWSAMEHFYI